MHKGVKNECTKAASCRQNFADSAKTGTSPHGISGVAVLLDQHIAKNCSIHAQCYSFKDSTKKNKQSKSLQFSKVRNSAKHKWFTYI